MMLKSNKYINLQKEVQSEKPKEKGQWGARAHEALTFHNVG